MQANIKGLLRTIKVLIFLDNKGFNECYRILLELVVAEMYRKLLLAIKILGTHHFVSTPPEPLYWKGLNAKMKF